MLINSNINIEPKSILLTKPKGTGGFSSRSCFSLEVQSDG